MPYQATSNPGWSVGISGGNNSRSNNQYFPNGNPMFDDGGNPLPGPTVAFAWNLVWTPPSILNTGAGTITTFATGIASCSGTASVTGAAINETARVNAYGAGGTQLWTGGLVHVHAHVDSNWFPTPSLQISETSLTISQDGVNILDVSNFPGSGLNPAGIYNFDFDIQAGVNSLIRVEFFCSAGSGTGGAHPPAQGIMTVTLS